MILEPIPRDLWPVALKNLPEFLAGIAVDLFGMATMKLNTLGPSYEPHGQVGLFPLKPYLEAPLERLFPDPPAAQVQGLAKRGEVGSYIIKEGSFHSPHLPISPQYAPYYFATPQNQNVTIRVFDPKDRTPEISLLFLHGWTMDHLDNLNALKPWELLPPGAAVRIVLMEAPFHMGRMPRFAQFSGEFFLSADIPRTIEAATQAVGDIRALLKWMKQTTPHVAVMGGSLGGFLTSLTVTQTDLPDFAVIIMPATDLTNLTATPMLSQHGGKGLQAGGYTVEDATAVGELLSPLSHPCQLPPQKILLVSGVADQFIHPRHLLLLEEHFGHPKLVWHAGGHSSIFFEQHRKWLSAQVLDFARTLDLPLAV